MTSTAFRRTLSLVIATALGLALALTGVAPARATVYSEPQEVVGAPVVPEQSVEFNGRLFLTGSSLNQAADGRLYAFDGSTFTPIDNTYYAVSDLVVVDDLLYFVARDADGWFVLVYDGTSVAQTGIESAYAGIDIVGYNDSVMAGVPQSATDTDFTLAYLVDGSVRTLSRFDFISDLVTFGDFVYFSGTIVGGSYVQMYRSDGVLVEDARPAAGSNMFVWKNMLYMGLIDQNWAFYRMHPDLTLEPAANPNIEYAFNFTDGGDTLYFTGVRGDVEYVYAYDGTTTVELPLGPRNVGDLRMFEGKLFATDLHFGVSVCSANVSIQCAYDFSDLYYFDGSGWVFVTQAHTSTGVLTTFNNRLYFQDVDKWMFVEQATLPNTGLNITPTVCATVVLVLLGMALMAMRRRNRASTTG